LKQVNTRYITCAGDAAGREALKEAAGLLRSGALVAFPTETVYGLGANIFKEEALERIFEVKGRPQDNPLIVHLPDIQAVKEVAGDLPREAQLLAERFWPGPLTLVLKKKEKVPARVSCGLPTVAVRVPSHPMARELLVEAGVPVAAPSANISGSPSPTRAEHVWKDLSGKIEAVVDGGSCEIGLESTVLDLTRSPPVLLRPGGITVEQVEECLGIKVVISGSEKNKAPASPGVKYRHYSPEAPLYLFVGPGGTVEEKMREHLHYWLNKGYQAGIICSEENPLQYAEAVVEKLGSRRDHKQMAATLYNSLRNMEARGVEIILVEGIPEEGLGLALMNRLKKASKEIIRGK